MHNMLRCCEIKANMRENKRLYFLAMVLQNRDYVPVETVALANFNARHYACTSRMRANNLMSQLAAALTFLNLLKN